MVLFGSKYNLVKSNKILRLYGKLFGFPWHIGARVRAYHVMKHLCPNEHDIILDAGCGSGVYALESALRGVYLIGVDLSRERICQAQKTMKAVKLTSRVSLIVADIRHLPFRKAVFNKTMCVDVLEHIEDDEKAVMELSRALKGKIIIHVPQDRSRFYRPHIPMKSNLQTFGHVREGYALESINHILKKADLNIIYSEETFKTFAGLAWEIHRFLSHSRMAKLAIILFPLLYATSRLDALSSSQGRGFLCIASNNVIRR